MLFPLLRRKVSKLTHVGGKAAALVRLHQAGLPVPRFKVIPYTDWSQPTADTDICWPQLRSLCSQLEAASDSFTRQVLASAARQEILKVEFPRSVQKILNAWLKANRSAPTIVRSSASSEDQPNSSSAGQYESTVVSSNESELRPAIRHVLASYYTDRAVAYRRSLGISQAGPRMAVILQQAVDAKLAGIIFGRDPIESDDGKIIIESSFGLGTTVVSGAVTPDRFVLQKESGALLREQIGSKKLQDHLSLDGRVIRRETPAELRKTVSLDSPDLIELWTLYTRIEKLTYFPQDVEWLKAADGFWIVQSRPITMVSSNGA